MLVLMLYSRLIESDSYCKLSKGSLWKRGVTVLFEMYICLGIDKTMWFIGTDKHSGEICSDTDDWIWNQSTSRQTLFSTYLSIKMERDKYLRSLMSQFIAGWWHVQHCKASVYLLMMTEEARVSTWTKGIQQNPHYKV